MLTSRTQLIVSLLVTCFVLPALSGCGGSSQPKASVPELEKGAAVVRVAGAGGVGQSALKHWIAVQAATNYNSLPTRPVPAGVVPDPPLYRQCIAQLRAEPIGPNPQNPNKPKPKPTDANLRKECEAKEEALRQHVLLILTSFQWLAGESAREGIEVSEGRVRDELERFRKGQFPTVAAFQAYIRNTGQTYQDELLRMRMDVYSNELARLAGERAHAKSKREGLEAFLRATPAIGRRWAARTRCSAGYITQNCANYKGTLEPELRI